VERVWGSSGPRSVVVVLPGTRALMAAALGRPDGAGLDRLAAVTSREPDRVVLNPGPFARLTPVGRQVVLTHELTHVATRASARLTPPLWVEEGFANFVAYRDAGLGAGVVAADVLPLVRQGRAPEHLPAPAEFDPGQGPIAPAYADAWLAFAVMAQGDPGRPVRFYRVAAGIAGGADSAGPALQLAFRQVLGSTEAGFELAWRAYRQRLA
jgi:hypothetical protein